MLNSQINVNLREYIFQKSYAEEMLLALKKYIHLICSACNGNEGEHVCSGSLLLNYWEEAKYYVSLDRILVNVNKRCITYGEEEYTCNELASTLLKLDVYWIALIQAIVSILEL